MQTVYGDIRALRDHVIVKDMDFGERVSSGGIVLLADDAKTTGIRPRWAQVYATGPNRDDLTIGQYVLIAHGRWTRGVKLSTPDGEEFVIRRVDNNDILAVSDEKPSADDTINN
jgi:co-chaperonin GroES (HSP10)